MINTTMTKEEGIVDITPSGDRGVFLIDIINDGAAARHRPVEFTSRSIVTIHYRVLVALSGSRHDDGQVITWPVENGERQERVRLLDDSFARRPHKPLQFRLGHGEVIAGVEVCVRSMKHNGQRSRFAIRPSKKYGFFDLHTEKKVFSSEKVLDALERNVQCMTPEFTGALGEYWLYYDIELVNVRNGDRIYENEWTTTTAEKLALATNDKEDGNILFGEKQYAEARSSYRSGLRALEDIVMEKLENTDQGEMIKKLRMACNLNISACSLKLQEYTNAAKSATEVLLIDPSNIKALFRRGQAYNKMAEYEKAQDDLSQALSHVDGSSKRSIELELQQAMKSASQFRERQKKAYSKMFQ